MTKELNKEEISNLIYYWNKNADEDLKTARSLFEAKRYHHCFFYGLTVVMSYIYG